MSNLWKTSYEEAKTDPPLKFIQEQCSLLPKLTGDMVYADIEEMDSSTKIYDNMSNDFEYDFVLIGKFLGDFSYRIMSFSYDISMYPVRISVNDEIAKSLKYESKISKIASQEELEKFIGEVLKSGRVTEVISSIIKLSKK